MGMSDRRYWREGQDQWGVSRLGMGMPRLTPAVKWLLIINVAVFVLQMALDQGGALSRWGGVTVAAWWQVWRFAAFQFMHDVGSPMHIVMNMLGLYFLGTGLEPIWGTRRFLKFYLTCGVAAGLAYAMIGWLGNLDPHMPIIGASGGVFALLLACAILLPHFQIILLFFPVPIRLAAVIIFSVMIIVVVRALSMGHTEAAMSDVAHLGGAVTAAVWVLLGPRLLEYTAFVRERRRQGAWERKMAARQAAQDEIDRILAKIHDQGLGSLSSREKKTLQNASKEQQREEERIRRL